MGFYGNSNNYNRTMATAAEGAGEPGSRSGGVSDSIVTEFSTYEDFLDSQITPTDLYYLEVTSAWILF